MNFMIELCWELKHGWEREQDITERRAQLIAQCKEADVVYDAAPFL
jgi:hypothetical protein